MYIRTYINIYIYIYLYVCLQVYMYIYIYTCIYVRTHRYVNVYTCPSSPMIHVNIFKGQPRRFALLELLQAWYKSFAPDHFGQVQINHSTMLRNKSSTA